MSTHRHFFFDFWVLGGGGWVEMEIAMKGGEGRLILSRFGFFCLIFFFDFFLRFFLICLGICLLKIDIFHIFGGPRGPPINWGALGPPNM